jgi:Domain of unknown function (DUF4333)
MPNVTEKDTRVAFPLDVARRAVIRRWIARSLVAGVLVTAGATVTAWGSTRSPAALDTATVLNTEKIERAIEQGIFTQRRQHAQVSCPSGVHQKKGLVFSCTAVVGQSSTRFAVTQLDGSGHVHYAAR